MNRFFTITLKATVFLFFVVLNSVSVSADEYKSMIRYDRVWEHISIRWDNKTVYYAKFDGAEEINGKTYHRFVSFRKSRYEYDKDYQIYLFDIDEDYYEHEGYMREEDGKVYTLVINRYPNEEFPIYEHLRCSPKTEELPYVEEKLLYDFTCKEGESYLGLNVHGEAEEITYKVESIEYVEIDGEQHLLQRVTPEGFDYIELPMVEGVGIDSEYGCLITINFLYIPTCPCMSHIFNRVLSSDGKTIYGNKNSNIPVGDFLGVDKITQPTKEDAAMYDVMGRRISSAAPGQLYIQGGKKRIGGRF